MGRRSARLPGRLACAAGHCQFHEGGAVTRVRTERHPVAAQVDGAGTARKAERVKQLACLRRSQRRKEPSPEMIEMSTKSSPVWSVGL